MAPASRIHNSRTHRTLDSSRAQIRFALSYKSRPRKELPHGYLAELGPVDPKPDRPPQWTTLREYHHAGRGPVLRVIAMRKSVDFAGYANRQSSNRSETRKEARKGRAGGCDP